MTTTTEDEAIKTAMGIARDIAAGKIDPAELERQAVTDLTALMDVEPEPDSALWELQADVCRRTLARGALQATEVAEWLAVLRARATEPDDRSHEPARSHITQLPITTGEPR